MNADVEKAVEAPRSPRVDALIDRVMQEHPGVSASAQARYYEAVHQKLAPLDRDQEAEIERLRNISDGNAELYQHEALRTKKAEVLLRECAAFMEYHSIDQRHMGEKLSLAEKITAHLGGENV